jgi:uncharacterized protein YgiB involved in biofilm formation
MRKIGPGRGLKPLALAVVAATMVGCSGGREAQIYRDVAQCVADNPVFESACEGAYYRALEQSARTSPKYRREYSCEAEFGVDNCVPYQSPEGDDWYMPAMGGFLFGTEFDDDDDYLVAPLYTSYSRRSPLYRKWAGADGRLYGSHRFGRTKVSKSAFAPKPTVKRTISRGGFGSMVASKARSSSGGFSKGSFGG